MAVPVKHSPDSRLAFATACIPGGKAFVGTDFPIYPADGEGPLRAENIDPFLMMTTVVTNDQFDAFVSDTGYVTEAEEFGWSFVFRNAVFDKRLIDFCAADVPWWCKINGANWRHPHGPGCGIEGRGDHPVVHVSWNDAVAFATWAGGRLPGEAEWEHSARGGLGDVLYPWGDNPPSRQDLKCHFGLMHLPDPDPLNIGPIAADSFSTNAYGLHNMVGNVWEWTADAGFSADRLPCTKILKGGSYLCHPKTCYRYRIAARISNTADSTLGHTGFRIVFPCSVF